LAARYSLENVPMDIELHKQDLIEAGASAEQAESIWCKLQAIPARTSPPDAWAELTASVLVFSVPFPVHLRLFRSVFADWDRRHGPPPAWRPASDVIAQSNITAFCKTTGQAGFDELREWSVRHRGEFWRHAIETLGIRFDEDPSLVLDESTGPESARWLPGARLNIARSCFGAPPDRAAIVFMAEGSTPGTVTYGELDRLSNRVARSFQSIGIKPGDAVAIDMPMTVEAVAAYLGIVKAGCTVVSIADSFAAHEISTRLRIADARAVFTQDVAFRGDKTLPMYQKVVDAGAGTVVVIPAADGDHLRFDVTLRADDCWWKDFLLADDAFECVSRDGDDATNILFSSGTTGDPKAIPWTHKTPIKCAMDAYLHHDVHPGDVLAWPTNLGWMMGPWLIYASLINGATMALYYGSPASREFCKFVQDVGVTMLGLVPSIVRAWKAMETPHGLDWSRIRVFSSTGEPSNSDDYLYLMSLAGYRPVIEYCGGTEIGGGYLCGTVVQDASPSTFTTPAFGLDLRILDDRARPADVGELFLVPPSIGLSDRLLNMDHHAVYYEGVPAGPNGEVLRRHGDEVEALPGGYYRAMGRADDTMNLGGIKVSSADLERAVAALDGVAESAAIGVSPPDGGPGRLVIYAVPEPDADPDRFALRIAMQRAISSELNPLFKVHDVVLVNALPRTASNKVMRRVLRKQYEERERSS
jgi:acetyl-CoA synthetase